MKKLLDIVIGILSFAWLAKGPIIVIGGIIFVICTFRSAMVKHEKEIQAVEQSLRDAGYKNIDADYASGGYQYNSATLLVIKQMDALHGPYTYNFTSTNFHGKVWYKISKK